MKRAILFISIGLFLLAVTVEGANWKLITQKQEKDFYLLVDQESIERISDSIVKAWVKYEHRKSLDKKRGYDCKKCSPEKTLLYTIISKEFDCHEIKSRDLELTEYYMDAAPYSEKTGNVWKNAAQDSIDGILLHYICKYN
jgi:hypothetical protein